MASFLLEKRKHEPDNQVNTQGMGTVGADCL